MTDALLLDAALWRTATDGPPAPDRAAVERLAAEHVERRQAAGGDRIAALLVPDTALAAVDRAVGALGVGPVDVAVVLAQGAGGLVALADREFGDLTVVAAHVDLQDLDDPAGNVARIGAAARTLPDGIEVRVGLPGLPGWQRAAEELDMEGLTAAVAADAEVMGALVELDVPFVVTAGADPVEPVLAAVHVLVEDADTDRARALLTGADRLSDGEVDLPRVRRRLRGAWARSL